MSPQRQRHNIIQRAWLWVIAILAQFLRFIGLQVSWGQSQTDQIEDALSAYEAKEAELRAFLEKLAEREKRIIEKYAEEYFQAARRGDAQMFDLYLSFGMPVNHKHPKTGETALHMAAARQARPVIRELLKSSETDYLIRDNRGRLASEMAHLYGRDPALTRLLGLKERAQGEAQGITVSLRP